MSAKALLAVCHSRRIWALKKKHVETAEKLTNFVRERDARIVVIICAESALMSCLYVEIANKWSKLGNKVVLGTTNDERSDESK